MTSWPCAARSAAATEESTPPDIATTTRMSPCSNSCDRPQFLDDRRHLREEIINIRVGVPGAQTDPDRVLGAVRGEAHCAQDVRRLEGTGRARGTRGHRDPFEIERNQERLRLDSFEADVGRVGHALGSRPVYYGAW